MRCFIGLDLSPLAKLALEHWREKALPEVNARRVVPEKRRQSSLKTAQPTAVPAANYHLTLAFLGSISHSQHDQIMQLLDNIEAAPIQLTLDVSGRWSGPKILFAAPSEDNSELMTLAKAVRTAARQCNIQLDRNDYAPHVTLVRKINDELPAPLFDPNIECTFSHFHLFESISGERGVHYPIRASWPLQTQISVRNQLKQGIIPS